MLKFYFLTAFSFVFALHANAQDSLVQKGVLKLDSIIGHHTDSIHNSSLDSLQKNFKHRTDSLQQAYAGSIKQFNSKLDHLKHKKDSLTQLNLSTQSVTDEISVVEQKQGARLKELNSSIDQIKKETLGKASSLQLPPQAQGEINSFTKNIQGFSAPDFSKMPGLNTKLPTSQLSIPSANIPSLPNLNANGSPLSSLSQAEQSLGKEISQAQSAANVQSAEKMAEQELTQNAEVKSLLKEDMQVKDVQGQLTKMNDPKNAEALAQQQLQPAVNHFAGKEQELKAAMDQVAKLKQKYSSVKSLAELPKRRPNPLKDKPWIERIIPGVNYYITSKHYTLVDFNPYVGWRFTPKLQASIGWNERVGISHYSFHTPMYDRVYGLRASASYTWCTASILWLALK